MKLLREWGFPIGLIFAWVVASAYTISALVDAKRATTPVLQVPASVSQSPES